MLGEIRDQETAEIALKAAITGHLVLSTLHTNNAIQTPLRLVDMGVAPYLCASAIKAVIAQRLIRKVCHHCKKNKDPEPWLIELFPKAKDHDFYEGEGCHYCNQTGYLGRVGVYEILEFNHELSEALRKPGSEHFVNEASKVDSYRPMSQSAFELAKQGITSLLEVAKITESVDDWQ